MTQVIMQKHTYKLHSQKGWVSFSKMQQKYKSVEAHYEENNPESIGYVSVVTAFCLWPQIERV